jgi:peptidoglycan DL-endopeptidase CwlO
MDDRTLTRSLATSAVVLAVTSSLVGLHRADAAERADGCARDDACVELASGERVSLSQFEKSSCVGSTKPADLRSYALARAGEHGWDDAEHGHLVRLWTRESNWRWDATNPTSGAYGIPQSLPATKMKSAGTDWKTNPCTQIEWGLGYIKQRYDSPSKAWAFWQRNNWY